MVDSVVVVETDGFVPRHRCEGRAVVDPAVVEPRASGLVGLRMGPGDVGYVATENTEGWMTTLPKGTI